jgi:hypothetical protein
VRKKTRLADKLTPSQCAAVRSAGGRVLKDGSVILPLSGDVGLLVMNALLMAQQQDRDSRSR